MTRRITRTAAREMMRFMVSPEAVPLLRKAFVEPAKL